MSCFLKQLMTRVVPTLDFQKSEKTMRKIVTVYVKALALSSLFIVSALLISCGGSGGGGGGSSDVAPALARLDIRTRSLEVGQQLKVIVPINDVQEDLAIKFRVPAVFEYLSRSSSLDIQGVEFDTFPEVDVLEVEEEEEDNGGSSSSQSSGEAEPTPTPTPEPTATPTPSGTATSGGGGDTLYNRRYLVFYIPKTAFQVANRGVLSFTLVPKGVLRRGFIELDMDVDDPDVSNRGEFSVEEPLFEAEDLVDVYVPN